MPGVSVDPVSAFVGWDFTEFHYPVIRPGDRPCGTFLTSIINKLRNRAGAGIFLVYAIIDRFPCPTMCTFYVSVAGFDGFYASLHCI